MSFAIKPGLRVMHLLALSLTILFFNEVAIAGQEQEPATRKVVSADDDLEKRAKAIADKFREKGMVELTDTMGSRVRGLFGEIDDEASGETVTDQDKEPGSRFRAILFASSSMPLKLLRAYAAQLEKANGVIVFRGIPGGMSAIKPIMTLTHKMILREADCEGQDCDVFDIGVMIDPLMFEANGVDRVPALTLVDHDPFLAYCERPREAADGGKGRFVTFGDAHLSGHFEALIDLGDPRARALLKNLEGSR